MKIASKEYIINTVFRTNILPIITKCNTSCVFCSHKQNPSEIEVFQIPEMKMEDFDELLNYISPNKKIVIGESATRIVEGEPLLHKDFSSILSLIRCRFPETTVQVTTNGILLTEELVDEFVRLGNIELNISVNCVDAEKRNKVLGIKRSRSVSDIIAMLKGRIKFSGSMVYIPDIMDECDVEDVVLLLDSNDAEAVRIFLPGYTDKTEKHRDIAHIYREVDLLIRVLRQKYEIPVIVEPPFINDLSARVEGVIRGTPSRAAGIMPGDIIREINGDKVNSRVEAYNKAFSSSNPLLHVERSGKVFEIRLKKPKNSSSGLVFLYDVDPEVVKQIERVIERNLLPKRHMKNNICKNKIWFLTSELAVEIIKKLLDISGLAFDYEIYGIKNRYFGGSIMCAGLLTIQDIAQFLEEKFRYLEKPDLILLPPVMFDFTKRDLLGRSIREIEQEFGVLVDTL
ncbi:MAG: DUF512 domain-containing protein [Clostridia bacterium]|nr:DUF512 domain-containing protein [Clostridia bacterium]